MVIFLVDAITADLINKKQNNIENDLFKTESIINILIIKTYDIHNVDNRNHRYVFPYNFVLVADRSVEDRLYHHGSRNKNHKDVAVESVQLIEIFFHHKHKLKWLELNND